MDADRPLVHICHAPADEPWVLGWLIPALGLRDGQWSTRDQDTLGELQIEALGDAVERSPLTLLVASGAAREDRLAQLGAALAQHAGLEDGAPRLIVLVRDRAVLDAGGLGLPLAQRAQVLLDVSDEHSARLSVVRLRDRLALPAPVDHRPACPYPGLAPFTAANRGLLCGREAEQDDLVRRIRGGQHALVVGPSGCGKSSLIHAAVLPGLEPADHVVQVVPRGDRLARALRAVVDALEAPELGTSLDGYVAQIRGATHAQVEAARAGLAAMPPPDPRRRVVVIDPLEEVFAEDDTGSRQALFTLLSGLWIVPWCTVILCMRTEFYGLLMRTRWWRELEASRYLVEPLDDAGLRRAITVPAQRAGVHVDGALVERLLREVDRDRSSEPLPLLQVALKELWAHLRWRYLDVQDYERIVDRDQRGLAAVLAAHADGILRRLPPDDHVIAQRVLLDLVHLGEGRPDTRRRRAVDDLHRSGDAPGQLARVLGALIEGRLVTTGDEAADRKRARRYGPATREASRFGRHVDLAHDALITRWPTLAGWIDEHRDELAKLRELEARAATPGLLTPAQLPEFEHWLGWTVSPAGQLLGASDALHDLVRRSVWSRRKRRAGITFVVTLVIAVAVAFWVQVDKTQQSIGSAMDLTGMLTFEVDRELRQIPGASELRGCLLRRVDEDVQRLTTLGELSESDRRIATMIVTQARARDALDLGHLEEAQALYLEMLADARRRAAADPDNLAWQRDLAVVEANLGEVARRAGKIGKASAWLGEALAIREQLVARDPTRTEWQHDRSVSYERQGDIAMHTGQLQVAHDWFGKALAVLDHPTPDAPRNADWQRSILTICDKLGDLASRTGQLGEARRWFDRELAVARELAAGSSGAQQQLDLAASYQRQSEIALAEDRLAEARDWIGQALEVRTRLVGAEPSNTEWRLQLASAHHKRGEIAIRGKELDDARDAFEQVIAHRDQLVAIDPSNAEWRDALAAAYERRGEIELYLQRPADARGWYEKALQLRRDAAGISPDDGASQRALAEALMMIGQVAGDPSRRVAALHEARAIYLNLQRDGAFGGETRFAELGANLEALTGTSFAAMP